MLSERTHFFLPLVLPPFLLVAWAAEVCRELREDIFVFRLLHRARKPGGEKGDQRLGLHQR